MDNLTLPQVDELTAYWAENPPVHILVKAYMGVDTKGRSGGGHKPDEDELRALAASFKQ